MCHMNSPTSVMKPALILKNFNQKHWFIMKKSASGYKRSKEWTMILAFCNTAGNNKLEFVFIEKSTRPAPPVHMCVCVYCACKIILTIVLTVWCNNKKSLWMNSATFLKLVFHQMHPFIRKLFKIQKC